MTRGKDGNEQALRDCATGTVKSPHALGFRGDAYPTLRIMTAVGHLRYVPILGEQPLLIGRGSGCDLRVTDPSLSRLHALVYRMPDGCIMVEDLGSTNGTFLNGTAIHKAILSPGDSLSLGSVFVRLENMTEAEIATIQQVHRQMEGADLDPLTGLRTRLKLQELLTEPSGRAASLWRESAVVLLDVDHFKDVNDQFGHRTGDRVLEEIGRILLQNIRDEDLAVRYGGDEMLILLCGAELEAAKKAAERIRGSTEAYDWNSIAKGLRVTITAGAAKGAEGETLDSFLDRADRMLYRAKSSGRNCVSADSGSLGPSAGPIPVDAPQSRP